MFKNKIAIYLVAFSLIILVGGILLFFKKDNSPKVVIKDLSSLSSKQKFSFKDAVGEQAPGFSLKNIKGETVKLSDYKGKNVILFFSGGSMCYPACWNQIEELANDKRLNTSNTEVFSVVVNPRSEWKKIIKDTDKFSNANLLFDTTKYVS